MKTFHDSLNAWENEQSHKNLFEFHINDDVRKSLGMLKDIIAEMTLLIVGFVVTFTIISYLIG